MDARREGDRPEADGGNRRYLGRRRWCPGVGMARTEAWGQEVSFKEWEGGLIPCPGISG